MLKTSIEQRLNHLGGLHPCIGPRSSPTIIPMSAEVVRDLEDELGAELPPDYRDFLLKYGCSRFRGVVRCPNATYYRIGHFYGGGPDENSLCHLKGALMEFEDRMPKSIMPIAQCDDGAICIGIASEELGRVYYWDREKEWDWQQQDRIEAGEILPKHEQFQNVTELAASFEEFILGLEMIDAE